MSIFRRLVHALVLVLTLIVGATAAAVIVSQTSWFKNWLRGYIIREADQYLNGQLSIDRLGGNLFFGVELENVAVSMDGSQVVAVKDLGLDYNVFELISKGLSIDTIRVDKPVLYLRREGDTWSISRLVKKQQQEADRSGPGRPIAIDDIGVSDGSIVIDGPVGTSGVDVPKRFDRLDAKLAFKYEPVRYSLDITHVSFRGSDPEIALNALSGGVSVRDDTLYIDKLALRTAETSLSVDGAVQQYLTKPVFALQVSSDKLSIPEIARLVPSLAGVRLQPAFEVKVNGPLDRLAVGANVRSSAGRASASLVADIQSPGQSVAGRLSVQHLNLAPILNNPAQKSDLTADATVDVRAKSFSDVDSLTGTVSVHAPHSAASGFDVDRLDADAKIAGRQIALDARAAAYGATATTTGHVALPKRPTDPVRFALDGRAQHVDLRRMPQRLKVPAADTDVSAAFRAAGSAVTSRLAQTATVDGNVTFTPSTVAGARIAGGSTVAFDVDGSDVRYRADATVSDLDLQRIGQQFGVPALAADRYKSSINAHVTASGTGTTPREMDVTAQGALTDTTVAGGRIPQLAFDVALQHDTAHVKVNGAVADVDPGALSGKPQMKGAVGGNIDVDATVANVSHGVTPDSVQATAKLELQPSTVAGLQIDRATLDGDYRDSAGEIRTLEVVGRDLNVKASGPIALNDTGESNLTLHADTPSLEQIGKLTGQPLTGIAKLDATVTGNKRELQAKGNFTGDGIKYGANGALTASSNFTVTVPELRAADASVDATTHATFVTLAGQNINDLTATTGYHQQQVDFDATAKQPKRSAALAGSLLLHPEHQEVHLRRLGLQAGNVSWDLAPGAQPAIQYGGNALAVRDLKLTSGDQQIAADGTFGRSGDQVTVTLSNVDLAGVDAMLLRPPQFSGRADATATIGGTKEAPVVSARASVTQGGFRQFHYDSLTANVDYGGKGVKLDAKLQQNPTQAVTAKGYVPIAVFSGPRLGSSRAHHEAASPADAIDLHIDSTPIDLGIVQGFTTALTKVTGTAQVTLDVTGAADDPHPSGAITVQNAVGSSRVDLQACKLEYSIVSPK